MEKLLCVFCLLNDESVIYKPETWVVGGGGWAYGLDIKLFNEQVGDEEVGRGTHSCTMDHITKSGRTLGDRFREHMKAPSPIHLHNQTIGHQVDLECFTIIERVTQGTTRIVKEAITIWVNDSFLNRNLCKYSMSYMWEELLQDTPSLQLN